MWDTAHLYVRLNSFSRQSSDSHFSCARRNVCLLNPLSNLRYFPLSFLCLQIHHYQIQMFFCTRRNDCLLNPPNSFIFVLRILSAFFCWESSQQSQVYIYFLVSMFTNILLPDFFCFQIRDRTFAPWILPTFLGFSLLWFIYTTIRFAFFVFARRNVCLLNPLGDPIFFSSFPCSQIY